MRQALVFGGSGQIGLPLLERLHAGDWHVWAASRDPQPARPGVTWLRGDLMRVDGLPDAVDAIFSCGPLDQFALWYAATPVRCSRVVAFGSTSVEVKQDSADAVERELAARLRAGEDGLLATAALRAVAATVLRPTLVYGAGRDRTLSRIARLAWRCHGFVLPRAATGLRQPVHVDDLAAAALAACDAVASHGGVYALPGGETLPYREMIARVLAALQPQPRLLEVPPALFAAALWGARALGRGGGLAAAAARLRRDQVFDMAPAQRDFGYAPRAFAPTARMFVAPDAR